MQNQEQKQNKGTDLVLVNQNMSALRGKSQIKSKKNLIRALIFN